MGKHVGHEPNRSDGVDARGLATVQRRSSDGFFFFFFSARLPSEQLARDAASPVFGAASAAAALYSPPLFSRAGVQPRRLEIPNSDLPAAAGRSFSEPRLPSIFISFSVFFFF